MFPPGVVERRRYTPLRKRVGVELVAYGSNVKFLIHNNSFTNLRRALMERVFNVERDGVLQAPPQPLPGVFSRLSGQADYLVERVGQRGPVTRQQFVDSRPVFKRRTYQAALDSLLVSPITRRDGHVDGAFVKCEKINSKKGDPAPRIIQPRTPRYNVEVGKYLAHVEHDFYAALDDMWGGKTVMKGLNADGVGNAIAEAWGQFSSPVAIGLDASRFDQHVSADALQFEHSIYNRVFSSVELARLLRWQVNNRGVGRADDGVIHYRKRGSRMSGDMNTALGNVILMVCMVHLYCTELGIHARLINNGDDCVLIVERRHLHLLDNLHAWFLNFGLI